MNLFSHGVGMTWLDWAIILIPLFFVMLAGFKVRKYVRGVADFLSAGRVCGRYVICVADVANALSILTLVAYVEVQYKTGVALSFWQRVIAPITLLVALSGYCVYRFRETRAMSLGQFLEMRYNRPLRIFAAALRSAAEMLTNIICPAIAARFFIYYFGFPHSIMVFGCEIPTFIILVLITLTLAITLIFFGGTLSLIVTDTLQGLFCYPMIFVMIIFVLCKYSWADQIVPVMSDRMPGESFLNPYDIEKLRDFNGFMLVVWIFNAFMHTASWIGGGWSTAAKTPHEQKMATVLGAWRGTVTTALYFIIGVGMLVVLNHASFAEKGKIIRDEISIRVVDEIVKDPAVKANLQAKFKAIPEQRHIIGKDKPLSETHNLDTPYLDTALKNLPDTPQGKKTFQEFRTLFHQLMLPITMRNTLPVGLLGLFALLLIMMMISTDDARIYSAALTITQDVIMPFVPGGKLSPKAHINVIRCVTLGIGVFFLLGSLYMSQLDYINLFIQIMTSLWTSGCGPVMIFGLYSRFGTTAGAFTSLVGGMTLALSGVFCQRNWATIVYPWLEKHGLVESVGNFLETVSKPFNPFIVWKMNPVKFPINSYEIYFFNAIITLFLYCVVSWLTCRKPFNLDRMLHRGKYNVTGEAKKKNVWSLGRIIGITPEYTKGDRIIARVIFGYSVVWSFVVCFVVVFIWNYFSRWTTTHWSYYYLVNVLILNIVILAVTSVWFTIGGIRDLRQMFVDLRNRVDNPLDNGRVEGNVSIVDKAAMEAVEDKKEKEDK